MATKAKKAAKRMTKKDIYAAHGIDFDNKTGKIFAPIYGWINPLLINGNAKIGKGVWQYSSLPTNQLFHIDVNGETVECKGTCACHCEGCYATRGCYQFHSTKVSLLRKTVLQRLFPDFVKRAILAQIAADKIKLVRIHVAGDFDPDNPAYIPMWREIVEACPAVLFWTYTKVSEAEHAFDDLANINVVHSIIEGYGFNFGHIDYIIRLYHILTGMGKTVHICRCGIDKEQHCVNCKGCATNEHVLFIEHSTSYVAEDDPLYPDIVALIESQQSMTADLLAA